MAPVTEGESILEKIQRELGIPLPTWAIGILSVLLLIGAVGTVLKPLRPGVVAVWSSTRAWLARRRQDQRRAERRARFADYIDGQMRRLGEKEEWRDNRYAELEAEVEVSEEGRRRFLRNRDEYRRLPSLSRALETVPHRLVLLEGDPGSGKSVALRHLTQLLCLRLIRRPSENDPIPLYINLKEFRPPGAMVSAVDVRDYVVASINRGRNRDIDRYMADEFDRGVRDGTWLFLFDSFDEIPAILSATEANETIERYSAALYDFLHDMGTCRGVVASREFRGPARRHTWLKFRIVPLTWARKTELVHNADLDATREQSLIDDLRDAPAELRGLSDNPMFLGLLCEHVREGNTFPETAHIVTETYVSERFSRDADRILDIFVVEPELVRAIAEELAFRIASEQSLGLTVERRAVVPLLMEHLDRPEVDIQAGLDALEYTKLARSAEDPTSAAASASITFSHRRIQEYFATCVVLRDTDRVETRSLVLDGRWREAAVTVLQVQDEAQVREVLEVVADHLVVPGDEPFVWRENQFPLLAILADGGGHAKYPPGMTCLSEKVDAILTAAWESGSRRNQKWTLEVCSAATPELALRFIREAFEGDSEWLRGEAYTQTRRVRQVTAEIEAEIRQTLLDFSISGDLRRSPRSIRAQVCRLANPEDLLHAIRLLRLMPWVDGLMLTAALLAVASRADLVLGLAYVVFFSPLWLVPRAVFARPGGNRARWRRAAGRVVGEFPFNARDEDRRVRHAAAAGFAFVFAVCRVALVFSAFAFVDIGVAIVAGAVALLLGIWQLGALLAVRTGHWLRPTRWPVLFVLPGVRLVRSVRAMSEVDWRKVGLALLIPAAAAGLLVAFGVFGIPLIARYLLLQIIWGVLAAACVCLFLAILGWFVVAFCRDLRRSSLVSAEVDAPWLAARLGSLQLPSGIVAFLRNLRTANPKPTWSGDALELLGSIGRQAEQYRAGNWDRATTGFVALWQAYDIEKHPRLRSFARSEVLDEIGRIEDESNTTRSGEGHHVDMITR